MLQKHPLTKDDSGKCCKRIMPDFASFTRSVTLRRENLPLPAFLHLLMS
ncbi:hypothetical protein KHS38_13050 [Mucilaginibacter sp. Bleaf8]|nr:hypothetical protein [Mucilaginibacter sp. Bleaf8]MBS7565334.1 hypothetical protein [Mucilaginibacter sp. Bleaf8]